MIYSIWAEVFKHFQLGSRYYSLYKILFYINIKQRIKWTCYFENPSWSPAVPSRKHITPCESQIFPLPVMQLKVLLSALFFNCKQHFETMFCSETALYSVIPKGLNRKCMWLWYMHLNIWSYESLKSACHLSSTWLTKGFIVITLNLVCLCLKKCTLL